MLHTLASYIAKVRTWGLKGVWNFFAGKMEAQRLRNYFLDNATRHPCTPSDEGLTLVAPFHATYSLGKVMRDFAFRLREAGIPFQAFDTGNKGDSHNSEIDALITPREEFRIMKYRHVVELLFGPVPAAELGLTKAHVAFWEFDSGLLETFPKLQSSDTVIAMSDFNAAYFRKVLPPSTPVAKILYPFRFTSPALPPAEETRKRFGIGKDDFVVFFNFDYGSSVFRKNPEGVMRAFAQAFPQTPGTTLVFKTNRSDEYKADKERLNDLAKKLGIADRLIAIDAFIPRADVQALTACCDTYMSLHRGEGFGLGIAEAMALAKPVIVADCGSTKEFCKNDNAILIPTKTIHVSKGQLDHPYYLSVTSCADPDIGVAAEALRRLHDSPELRRQLGEAGKAFIAEHFSMDNFGKSVREFLSMQQNLTQETNAQELLDTIHRNSRHFGTINWTRDELHERN